jgi:hypothetical protein
VTAKVHASLTKSEVQAIFQLVIKYKQPPDLEAELSTAEALLLVAADLLKTYGFDPAYVLTVASRLWSWLGADDRQVLMINIVDRRYVGWNPGPISLTDMITGGEVGPEQALSSRVLESVCYNIYELLDRRKAMARGERGSLWEGKDAAGKATCGAPGGGSADLGEPQVVCDDLGAPIP